MREDREAHREQMRELLASVARTTPTSTAEPAAPVTQEVMDILRRNANGQLRAFDSRSGVAAMIDAGFTPAEARNLVLMPPMRFALRSPDYRTFTTALSKLAAWLARFERASGWDTATTAINEAIWAKRLEKEFVGLADVVIATELLSGPCTPHTATLLGEVLALGDKERTLVRHARLCRLAGEDYDIPRFGSIVKKPTTHSGGGRQREDRPRNKNARAAP